MKASPDKRNRDKSKTGLCGVSNFEYSLELRDLVLRCIKVLVSLGGERGNRGLIKISTITSFLF